jgi:hypothetical protein
MAANLFTDLTEKEFKKLLGFRGERAVETSLTLDSRSNPASVDWRQSNAVNAIKDQG